MPTFQLTVMPNARQAYLDLLSTAVDGPRAVVIRMAYDEAIRLLNTNARNAGEPLYDLKLMRMRVCRSIVAPLYIEFGVHFNLPSAFIRRIVLLL